MNTTQELVIRCTLQDPADARKECGHISSSMEAYSTHRFNIHCIIAEQPPNLQPPPAKPLKRRRGAPVTCTLPNKKDPVKTCGKLCCSSGSFFSHRLRVHGI